MTHGDGGGAVDDIISQNWATVQKAQHFFLTE